MKRSTLIEMLAEKIAGVRCPHPVRIAIDGVDGVGKTTLADELAGVLSSGERPVIRASVDGFHNPRSSPLPARAQLELKDIFGTRSTTPHSRLPCLLHSVRAVPVGIAERSSAIGPIRR